VESLGILLVILGSLVVRQVVRGRSSSIPADTSDIVTGLFTGNFSAFTEVLSRQSDTTAAQIAAGAAVIDNEDSSQYKGTRPVDIARTLGHGSTYVSGGTGPKSYDCSGLVWRAEKDAGIYPGARFTTHTFTNIAPKYWTKVSSPENGDIVIWVGHHMGYVVGPDTMYSALSTNSGIKESSISGETAARGQPQYWRHK